jgi:hypothetical protein
MQLIGALENYILNQRRALAVPVSRTGSSGTCQCRNAAHVRSIS